MIDKLYQWSGQSWLHEAIFAFCVAALFILIIVGISYKFSSR